MTDENKIKKILGENVRELRTQKNITQEKLAEFLDLQTQTITAIENGKTFISCEVLAKLSNYFNVEPMVLFSPKINLNEIKTEQISKIQALLPKFNQVKLEEIYNILLVMHN